MCLDHFPKSLAKDFMWDLRNSSYRLHSSGKPVDSGCYSINTTRYFTRFGCYSYVIDWAIWVIIKLVNKINLHALQDFSLTTLQLWRTWKMYWANRQEPQRAHNLWGLRLVSILSRTEARGIWTSHSTPVSGGTLSYLAHADGTQRQFLWQWEVVNSSPI